MAVSEKGQEPEPAVRPPLAPAVPAAVLPLAKGRKNWAKNKHILPKP